MAMDGKNLWAKDEANIAFDRANMEKAMDQRSRARQPQAPQPTLTPGGSLQRNVDAKVREQQEAIKAKFERDRARERNR